MQESVDIMLNVRKANVVLADARSQGRQLRVHELPISAMTRPGTPVIAIKYSSLSDGTTKRFQLKFVSMDDFRIAHRILSVSGIQISESAGVPKPVSRASSSHTVPAFNSSIPPSSPPKVDFWNTPHEAKRPASSAVSAPRLAAVNERPSPRPFTAPTSDPVGPSFLPPRRELPFSRPPSSSAQSLPSPAVSSNASSALNQFPDDNNQNRRNIPHSSSADLPPLLPPRLAALAGQEQVSSSSASLGHGRPSLDTPTQLLHDLQSSDLHSLEQHHPSSSSEPHQTNMGQSWGGRSRTNQSSILGSGIFRDRADSQVATPAGNVVSSGNNPALAYAGDAALAAYASQSARDREHQLDSIFANCIHDDNFIVLCQDVASHWQRFYLGSI
ncbi:hypothetical protein IWZ00DRAFT_492367 [Phyllosticta capitalensis]|uniref:Uncharacterized protein n=1 Tax=Phyllosticta capitalensis TaxID=121624 RepID=A0ABR1YMS7_9PEZI